ncbi:hypothetical protein F4678DRAFT_413744 [Xylaria arbuscula]|nr:hypothetical protein F4678DRAFT_413744 [Xylaria arbuscula]
MDNGHQRKRRRLDHPEITATALDILSSLALSMKDIGRECGVFNVRTDAAASHAIDTTVTGINDSVNPDLVCYGMVRGIFEFVLLPVNRD